MGTNSKADHSSYAIAPSAPAPVVAGEPSASPVPEELSDEAVVAKTDLMFAMNRLETITEGGEGAMGGYPDLPDDPVERFEIFEEQIRAAREAIEKLKAEGASDEEIQAHLKALAQQSLAYLVKLDPAELQQIAAAKGFEHPALVGWSGKGNHALVHWLDPYYDDGPSKHKVQACALQRYDQLVAGESLGGMTLTDLHQIEGTAPASSTPAGTWVATPEQIQAAKDAHDAAVNSAAYAKGQLTADQLQALLSSEQQLLTAHCPDVADMDTIQVQAKLFTDDALHSCKVGLGTVVPAVHDALAAGDLTLTEAQRLKPLEVVALMRASATDAEKESLKALAQSRQAQLADLDNALEVYKEGKFSFHSDLSLPDLDLSPDAPAHVAAWAQSAGTLHDLQHSANEWVHEVLEPVGDIGAKNAALLTSHMVDPKTLTSEFNAWAKGQKVSDLRAVAEQLGMPDTGHAKRGHLQSYIAASFNPALDKNAINDLVTSAAAKKAMGTAPTLATDEAVAALTTALVKKPQVSSHPTPSASGPEKGGTVHGVEAAGPAVKGTDPPAGDPVEAAPKTPPAKPAPKAPVKPAPPGSFNAKIQALVADVQQQHKAAAKDVPPRIDSEVVKAWEFGAGQTAHLGGTYQKSVHSGPDGSSWLFKADHHGGVVAHSEAAASQALAKGGVPTVPVYVKEIGGTVGSVQPMLKGATPFSSGPESWTQSEVDAIVRMHVGSWMVSDHDGHAGNMLHTASGGVIQVDRGQSFKHFGQDRLALDYAPSGGGAHDPVHQRLYAAALSGGLASGVKINPAVAHPIIKAFEAVPDAQWRSVLHSTAHEGAKSGSGAHWVPAMRQRAAAKHGLSTAQVSHDQVVEAFLEHAVERKQSLRSAFAKFFVEEVQLPQAASLKHGS
jgi:hypothetical protein